MATDQEDGPAGPTVPAGSSNAVPQGPQRKTTNLESASLRKQANTTENTEFQPREAASQAALSRQQRQRASPPPPSLSDSNSLAASHRPGWSLSLSTSTSLSHSRSRLLILYSLSTARRDTPLQYHSLGVASGGWPPPSRWPTCRMANSGTQ
jgi:hypothetical protein